jgi:uncharacterized protein YukE
VTRPTVAQAQAWRPQALRELADAWDEEAQRLASHVNEVAREVHGSSDVWRGAAADTARHHADALIRDGDAAARALVMAAVAARDGADQIGAAQAEVLARVSAADKEGLTIADDGSASPRPDPPPMLVALFGGSPSVTRQLLAVHAPEVTRGIIEALDRLGAADADAAGDIAEAFASAPDRRAAPTVPAGASPVSLADAVSGWPVMSQDRIAAQISAMTAEQRRRLVHDFPQQVGNTDGLPWDMRIAANRVNIAQAVLSESGDDPEAKRRRTLYQSLLSEADDPANGARRVDRQILAFDPARASLVELHGDLSTARSVAVLVPGLNTTMEGSAANNQTARRFVSASRGDVAMITYLGGRFPQGDNVFTGLVDAANPRYALDMAPRLAAFSEDVERTVDSLGRGIAVTYIGHSYGASILGTAEAIGLTADRTLYLAAAGAGVGVDDPGDWHNRNPDVLRFSMTAPGDFIQAVQGIPGGPHGADPDEMPDVTHLETGRYDDGRPMAGPNSHSDVLNAPSDAWRTLLAVITGDSATWHKAS